ncbi:hypothetical protein LCGC14_1415650 [marine sediment metagenome]|uniref:Uncharacterized protein n=1 Tax=marine sediment metagenome TaxID=412755 RepID=A0A0F9KE36_9ZZZZ
MGVGSRPNMPYTTKAKRRDGGGYDFSFGSKGKKLLAVAEKVAGKWQITDGFASNLPNLFVKLRDLKVSWGELAATSYGQASPPSTTRGGPPSIRKGPPSLKPKPPAPVDHGPTCPECERPVTGWFDDLPPCRCNSANDVGYTPDPFDRKMYSTERGGPRVSEYGALDMVYHWMMRNAEYVQTEGVMDSPWKEVQETLWRNLGYAEYRPSRFDALAEPGESIAEPAA